MTDTWNRYAKRLLKAELLKREIGTEELILLLERIGIEETKSSINSKISRGTFSASFLFQVLSVIGCTNLEILKPRELELSSTLLKQAQLKL